MSVIRGCVSDQDTAAYKCSLAGAACIKCSEEFCNEQGYKSYSLCFTCSSDYDDTCGYTQDDFSESISCETLLGRENYCLAYGNQTHFKRGCLLDYPEMKSPCIEHPENCRICGGKSCNSMKLVNEFCLVCDSSIDPGCVNVAESPPSTLCGEGTIDKSGCYLSVKGIIIANS